MKLDEIKTPVASLSGIGPAAEKLFAKLNIFTIGDLLKFYPRAYEDRRHLVSISQFESAKVHTPAQVTAHEFFGYGRMKTLKIIISDGTASAGPATSTILRGSVLTTQSAIWYLKYAIFLPADEAFHTKRRF